MSQPTVSVIVPVYNLEEYLPQCVESLTAQSFQDIEILLVDDGSTDGSSGLCDQYAGQDGRIKVIHKENGGLVSAWKRGLEESVGQYVCFVDGDDWIEPEMITGLMSETTGKGKEIIACDYLVERKTASGNGTWKSNPVYQELAPGAYERPQLEREVFPRLLGNENRLVCFSRCMKLITRELMSDNAHYSEESLKMGEDLAVMLPAILDCERLVILDHKAWYHYFYNQTSMVHKYDPGMMDNLSKLRRIMNQVVIDKADSAEQSAQMKKVADQEYLLLVMLALKNEARGNKEGYQKNIREICVSEEMQKLLRETALTVKDKKNRLLYMVMRHPDPFWIRILRVAMVVYYG